MVWLLQFLWFMKESTMFLNKNIFWVIKHEGIQRGIVFANEMCRYNKLTPEQKLLEYTNKGYSL